jgi:tRNA 2-selenouridine synthase
MRRKYIYDCFDTGYLYLDIRSGEAHQKGHIPGSISVPLGYELKGIGRKTGKTGNAGRRLLAEAAATWASGIMTGKVPDQPLIIYNTDGGIAAEFARDAISGTFSAFILRGGYRKYRRNVRRLFGHQFPFIVLAGKTGTGKTLLLQKMHHHGKQVLNLEALAGTAGSAFGRIGIGEPQPSQEQFENLLAHSLMSFNPGQPIFVEEETRPLGQCYLPAPLADQLSAAPRIILHLPKAERVRNLVKAYAGIDDPALIRAIHSVSPRLGEKLAGRLIELVHQKAYEEVAGQLLSYYDHAAGYNTPRPGHTRIIKADNLDALFNEVMNMSTALKGSRK